MLIFVLGLALGAVAASLVLVRRCLRLRRELRQVQHALGLYRTDSTLAGLRREARDTAQAFVLLRRRHEEVCQQLGQDPGVLPTILVGGGKKNEE